MIHDDGMIEEITTEYGIKIINIVIDRFDKQDMEWTQKLEECMKQYAEQMVARAREEIRGEIGNVPFEPIFMQQPVVFNGKYYVQLPDGVDKVTVVKGQKFWEFTPPSDDGGDNGEGTKG